MNKEQKLAILSKAIDEGASIDVSFHECSTIQEAMDKVDKFYHWFDESFRYNQAGQHLWMNALSEDKTLEVAVFFNKEEKKEQNVRVDAFEPHNPYFKHREVEQEGRYWVTSSSTKRYCYRIELGHIARYLIIENEMLTDLEGNTAYMTVEDEQGKELSNFISANTEPIGGYRSVIDLGKPNGEYKNLYIYLRSETEGAKVKLRHLKAKLQG